MNNKQQSINEFDEIFDKVYPNQINLKSFRTKEQLNPRIWENNDMKKVIRRHLNIIAKDFVKGFEIPDIRISDIIVVGSIAGYNWSKYSDVDLHIMIDFSAISNHGDKATLKKFFDGQKNDWNQKHNILIYGYPVELYVQDINETNASDGIYSVKYAKWLKVPTAKNPTLNKDLIKKQASQYINIIDKISSFVNSGLSKNQCRVLKTEAEKLYEEIVQGRRKSLPKEGEYASGNIVFKVLRRTGHLDKLWNLKNILFDKIISL